ncbi:TPA: hypothetical protein PXM28_003190 [Yersinia enterocolitica]|nr:hypothetical protein [Yersinia enterocolitica]
MENIIVRLLINITFLTMLGQPSRRENVLRKIFAGKNLIIGISLLGQKQKQPHKETVFTTLTANHHS